MSYEYVVDLYGTWEADQPFHEINWFLNRLRQGEGNPYAPMWFDDAGKPVRKTFSVVSITPRHIGSSARRAWVATPHKGRFHIRMDVKADTPGRAMTAAQKRVKDFLSKVTCTPPVLVFE